MECTFFAICTSLFVENCQKKFGTVIFGHSKLVPVFLGKMLGKIQNGHFCPFQIYPSLFRKNSEWPFLAIPNLYLSFWEKLSEKIQNSHFWPFRIYTSLFGENCREQFGMAIFGHSKFVPVFLGKIVRKNSEQQYLAIPNLYQSFWEKLLGKHLEQPFLAILNLYLSFWKKMLEKIQNSHFWSFQIYISLFGKNCWKKIQNGHFWPF